MGWGLFPLNKPILHLQLFLYTMNSFWFSDISVLAVEVMEMGIILGLRTSWLELWWRRCLILISSSVVLLSCLILYRSSCLAIWRSSSSWWRQRYNWLVLWLRGNWTDNVHFQIQIAAACYVLRCVWYCWGKLSASEMVILRNTVPNSKLYSAFRGSSWLDPKFLQLAKDQATRQLHVVSCHTQLQLGSHHPGLWWWWWWLRTCWSCCEDPES